MQIPFGIAYSSSIASLEFLSMSQLYSKVLKYALFARSFYTLSFHTTKRS